LGSDVDVRGKGPHLSCDSHNLPFIDESFGLYYAMAVYEHPSRVHWSRRAKPFGCYRPAKSPLARQRSSSAFTTARASFT